MDAQVSRTLELSAHLALESYDADTGEQVIFNSMTGSRVSVNKQVLRLLQMCQTPITIDKLFDLLELEDETEQQTLAVFIDELVAHSILSWSNEKDSLLVRSQELADSDLLTIQSLTFLHCPSGKIEEVTRGTFAFCGACIDFGTTGKSGTKLGPNKLREVSGHFLTYDRDIFTRANRGWFNAELGRMTLVGSQFMDVGNISHVLGESPEQFFSRVKCTMEKICRKGGIPICIGGDHSISEPAIAGCTGVFAGEEIVVVHFDAHTDLGEWIPGTTHHHGNVMRRMLHTCPTHTLLQLGIRGFAGALEESSRFTTITQAQIENNWTQVVARLPVGKKCYITLDVDVLDPSYAPGTGTPVPLGMQPRQLLQLLKELCIRNEIIGVDVVELCPDQDYGDMTSSIVFHILMTLLAYIYG